MNILDLLVGKKVSVMTEMKVEVLMEIKSITEDRKSREITPSTRENDWWGESVYWSEYIVTFTNGAKKTYPSLESIQIMN